MVKKMLPDPIEYTKKQFPAIKPGMLGNQWGSNPRPSESQSDALTN